MTAGRVGKEGGKQNLLILHWPRAKWTREERISRYRKLEDHPVSPEKSEWLDSGQSAKEEGCTIKKRTHSLKRRRGH